MTLFTQIDQPTFLSDYWQKKTCVFTQAFSNLEKIINGDDLKALANEDDCEARIITGLGLNNNWQCWHGPFSNQDFQRLDKNNWTLLIQGLDHWNTDVRDILLQFDFLPKWRLEDIMASYAPIGGGVGPHFDYYDVFLIQASGTREWQLGQQCNQDTKLQNNTDVKLLAEFNTQETHNVKAGDVLYIPAGLAHWGTASSNDCITLSVGFRAPSHKEILIRSLELLTEELSTLEDTTRYQDNASSIDQNKYKINQTAISQLNNANISFDSERLEQLKQTAFGQLVTEPRYSENANLQESLTTIEIANILKRNQRVELIHTNHTRFAFTEKQLFIDGLSFDINEHFSKMVCDKVIDRSLSNDELNLLVEIIDLGATNLKI